MAWTNLTYAFASLLTSTKMTQNQANFAALAAGDSGAPTIVGSNVTSILGSWISKTNSISYIASMDLMVTATSSFGTQGDYIYGYTDSAATPTTIRARERDNTSIVLGYRSISFPVRKGDYYRVITNATIVEYFVIPVGI